MASIPKTPSQRGEILVLQSVPCVPCVPCIPCLPSLRLRRNAVPLSFLLSSSSDPTGHRSLQVRPIESPGDHLLATSLPCQVLPRLTPPPAAAAAAASRPVVIIRVIPRSLLRIPLLRLPPLDDVPHGRPAPRQTREVIVAGQLVRLRRSVRESGV